MRFITPYEEVFDPFVELSNDLAISNEAYLKL